MTDTPICRWLTGKLPPAELGSLLASLPQQDPRVLLGPKLGEDAAAPLDFGDRCLVAAADPVTFAIDRIGWYAVHINTNDVVVLGAEPRWFLAVLLLPEGGHTLELEQAIMTDIGQTCENLGVTVCGGHTEVTCTRTPRVRRGSTVSNRRTVRRASSGAADLSATDDPRSAEDALGGRLTARRTTRWMVRQAH